VAVISLSGTGVWSGDLRYDPDAGARADAVAELDALGYTAVWIPDIGGDVFEALDVLLGATQRMTVASGILNIWRHEPAETGRWWAGLDQERKARTLIGLGVSHGPLIGETWRRPLTAMREYLDGLDEAGVPVERRCLAALGARMLDLARDRSAGAHPYLVTPEHTGSARKALGADALLAVEQGVVLESDPGRAREIGRTAIQHYCALPNYANNWLRLGYTQEDIDERSDRLVDGLVAWGDLDAIKARVDAHRAAGADHVCIQVLEEPDQGMPRAAWRELAAALAG